MVERLQVVEGKLKQVVVEGRLKQVVVEGRLKQVVVERRLKQVVVEGRLKMVVVEEKLKQVEYVRGLLADAGSRLTCCSLRLEGFGTRLLAGCKTVVGEVGTAGSD